MSAPSKPDRSLLDRLNALKPSSISLAAPQQSSRGAPTASTAPTTADDIASSTFSSAAPSVTREDRLAARLKTLREVRDSDDDDDDDDNSGEPEKPVASSSPEQAPNESDAVEAADDPLFYVDDEAVNDLLLELAAEGLGEDEDLGEDEADRLARGSGDDNDDDGFIPLPSVPQGLGDESSGDEGNDADNAKRVEDLLKSLAGTTIKDSTEADAKKDAPDDGDPDDSDDSDGDDMGRKVRQVLEQAQDEADLAKQKRGDDGSKDEEDEEDEEDIVTGPRKRDLDQEDESILPRDKTPINKANAGNNDDADNFLGLPAVPTKLVDPPPSPPSPPSLSSLPSLPTSLPSVPTQALPQRGDDDDISARLAALRGLQGKAAGLGQTDAFGLPSAPTFRPGEEEGGILKRGHYGHGRRNYTDADQKAWCVVCLEDATVRCLGCADNGVCDEEEDDDQNNAYCTRCWRDMHVGPAAGFDERGHKRVPLVR